MGVDMCFANPGTSEMQLVAAIGESDTVHPVLCLYEGVVSGAADGYGRMADRPALTLLHLGSGFSNSMANLHNAKRAGSPIVNVVGDHADYHLQCDAPLTSDLPGLVDWASDWMKVAQSPDDLALAGGEAVYASMQGNGRVATVVAPANHAWDSATGDVRVPIIETPVEVDAATVATVAAALSSGRRTALFLGGRALRESTLEVLGKVSAASGADLWCQTFPARLQRGAGRVPVQRLPYFAEQATEALAPYEQVILIGAKAPVSFFAYPGKASWLIPEQSEIVTLATAEQNIASAAESLLAALSPNAVSTRTERVIPRVTEGALTPVTIGQIMSCHMPEGTIVSDEGATCGLQIYAETHNAAAHDWLTLTGGAIGQGLPVALGAAKACPDRKVVALQADGSAMYTIQALWSIAREQADVTVVLLNNRSYAILNIELERVGAGEPTPKTLSMLDLSQPDMDFHQMARSLGVDSSRVTTTAEFEAAFGDAMRQRGPKLIECVL